MTEKEVGEVTHYYSHLGVAIVKLSDTLKVGDNIHIKGHTSDFQQSVDSMQIEHANIQEAKPGELVGIKVKEHVREHDILLKVLD